VTFEIRIFRGHRLEIEERLRMSEDNKSLLYTQAITGPDGKVGHYEVAFEVTHWRLTYRKYWLSPPTPSR
jgi:hypothetical protein